MKSNPFQFETRPNKLDLISHLAPFLERYVTVCGVHPSKTYNYKARGMFALPAFDVTMHRPKCGHDAWLYIAVESGADLTALGSQDKLYVGSQTKDRMFRGDRMSGMNFHHAEMRAGRDGDTPRALLDSGRTFDICRIGQAAMTEAVQTVPALRRFEPLLTYPTKHAGYWFEQLILHVDGRWRWNTNYAFARAVAAFRHLWDAAT